MVHRSGRAALLAAALIGSCGGAHARELVAFEAGVQPGTVVVSTSARRLYLVLGNGAALAYPVAVGKPGKQWFGPSVIDGKHIEPAWAPPAEVKRDNPRLPDYIPGGARNNPMGARALTLSGGEYAIHGTNNPASIGNYASYGCIRMLNRDIIDLYERVAVGTPVVVVR